VPTKKHYFILWEDGRNAEDPNADWSDIADLDIYGKWMSPNVMFFSDEIIFRKEPEIQRYSSIGYSQGTDRMLIAWQDVVDEDLQLGETDGQAGRHVREQGGNIYSSGSILSMTSCGAYCFIRLKKFS
jgi:hypothetical protein